MLPPVARHLSAVASLGFLLLCAEASLGQFPTLAPQPQYAQPQAYAQPQYAQPQAYAPAPLYAPSQQITSGDHETQTVVAAQQALDQFFAIPMESVPPAMLQVAEGIAIFPNMIKGGFILGVNYGKGVLHVRNPDRTWSPPVMVTMGGGSIGFQAGVQAADIVLVFATPRSLQGIMNGQKVTLGADASIAAGPVGRSANAATDPRLGAEIYSYARSRGLFLGVSLGGSDISVDHNADAMLYGRFNVSPADIFSHRGIGIRPEVQMLVDDLNAKSRPQLVQAPAAIGAAPAQAFTQPGPQAITPFGAPAPVPPAPVPLPPAPVAAPQPVAPVPPAVPQAGANPPLVPIQQR
ncbi:MAG: ligand-binding protein SH3 [Planctomycetota bacterium]|nr:MAG: ligand-binding protein SH3 [Planctomycetota bacterium]